MAPAVFNEKSQTNVARYRRFASAVNVIEVPVTSVVAHHPTREIVLLLGRQNLTTGKVGVG